MAPEPRFAHVAETQSFTRRPRARWVCGTVANRCGFPSKLNPSRAEKRSYNNPASGTLPYSLPVYLLILFTFQVLRPQAKMHVPQWRNHSQCLPSVRSAFARKAGSEEIL